MTPVEVIVDDGHVGDGFAAFDGDVVVAGADEGVGDGDVFGAAWVYAVGVAGEMFWSVDFEAPDGEAVTVVVNDVEVGGVLEDDAVEGEVVCVVGDEDAGDLLARAGAGLFGEVTPGDWLAMQVGAEIEREVRARLLATTGSKRIEPRLRQHDPFR